MCMHNEQGHRPEVPKGVTLPAVGGRADDDLAARSGGERTPLGTICAEP